MDYHHYDSDGSAFKDQPTSHLITKDQPISRLISKWKPIFKQRSGSPKLFYSYHYLVKTKITKRYDNTYFLDEKSQHISSINGPPGSTYHIRKHGEHTFVVWIYNFNTSSSRRWDFIF
jgi:hypothetical protein